MNNINQHINEIVNALQEIDWDRNWRHPNLHTFFLYQYYHNQIFHLL